MIKFNYIGNNETKGIDYDWNRIKNEYRKLKCPPGIFDPCTAPIEKNSYLFYLSIRSVGKTTGWLLMGMIMHELYGTTVCYVRETEEQTAPKYTRELLNVILDYEQGRYIKDITRGAYNGIVIDTRRLYYVLRDENGKEIVRSAEPFLVMLSLDLWTEYKSTMNFPRGDLFIFDEFIGKYYREDSFINFMQILSTIGRRRHSLRIVMLANNAKYTSPWYREFMIQNIVRHLEVGEKASMVTPKGTPIYIEFVEPKLKKDVIEHGNIYFGFDNPGIAAITGTDIVWAFPDVPRIKVEEDDVLVTKQIRIRAEEDLKLSIWSNSEIGVHVRIYPTTSPVHADEIVLTLDTPKNRQELFALGAGDLFRSIWNIYKKDLFFFSDNETGAVFDDYYQRAKEALRKRS